MTQKTCLQWVSDNELILFSFGSRLELILVTLRVTFKVLLFTEFVTLVRFDEIMVGADLELNGWGRLNTRGLQSAWGSRQ